MDTTTTPVDNNNKVIAVVREDMNRLRGRLFGAIEAAGMPLKQENAIKGMIRNLTYDAQANLEAALRRNGRT